MDEITLPAPGGKIKLKPNLALVAELEREASLLKTAERLLAREMKLCEMLPLLRACYRAAGCAADDAALDEFLLGQSPGALLAEILAAILSPLSRMGALSKGEAEGPETTAPAARIFGS
jgi:hypothetical protein